MKLNMSEKIYTNYLYTEPAHCFSCHTEHENIGTCFDKSQSRCTKKCGKYFEMRKKLNITPKGNTKVEKYD